MALWTVQLFDEYPQGQLSITASACDDTLADTIIEGLEALTEVNDDCVGCPHCMFVCGAEDVPETATPAIQ